MNCKELREDINKLREIRDSLSASYKKMNETGVGNRETQRINRKVTELEDKLLEKYLDVFTEKNPEILSFKLGEKIEGFGDYIYTSTKLSDDMVFVGGGEGEARILKREDISLETLKKHIEDIAKKGEV